MLHQDALDVVLARAGSKSVPRKNIDRRVLERELRVHPLQLRVLGLQLRIRALSGCSILRSRRRTRFANPALRFTARAAYTPLRVTVSKSSTVFRLGPSAW